MKEETEIKRFERLCKEVGIPVTTINFHVTQQQVYKLFLATKKECEGKNSEEPEINIEKNVILKKLKRYSSGLTIKELSNLLTCPEDTMRKIISEMEKEGTIKNGNERWKLKKTS